MTGPVIGVNMAIRERGISGTARVAGYILDAVLGMDHTVAKELVPPPRHRGVRAAINDARWDMWSAGRSPKLNALLSPCNIGRAPRGLPHVLWVQDTMVLEHPQHFDTGYRWYLRSLIGTSVRSATAVVTASDYAAERISRRWTPGRLEVIGWPAFPRERSEAPENTGFPTGELNVLMVGTTLPHKNHALAVQAVEQLRTSTGANATLRIVGPAHRAEADLMATIDRVDPSRRWITRERAPLTDAELDDGYARAWVLLQASVDEGFCLPIMEAAARGLPVVHSGGGAMRELLPHAAAADGSAAALCDALAVLLDPAAHASSRTAGLRCASRHTWAGFQRDLEAVVRSVL